jgi:hypothetical protein
MRRNIIKGKAGPCDSPPTRRASGAATFNLKTTTR